MPLKQPAVVRQYVSMVMNEALQRIRARLSMMDWPSEREAFEHLDKHYLVHLGDVTGFTMKCLGHQDHEPADARFSVNRRTAAKVAGKNAAGKRASRIAEELTGGKE